MTKTLSRELAADLRALVEEAISRDIAVNIASVVQRLNDLHPDNELPSEVLEARILNIAQQFNAAISFKPSSEAV